MVFTYREIQTWRADAWSRDLIRTLLRTHTLALCGYSGADPILHATFREVYEERASAIIPRAGTNRRSDAEHAPVFFFGISKRREFHSLEILRAATAAAGYTSPKLVDHPNLIEFETKGFPSVDDHFRLIVHTVVRHFQRQALTTHLRRLSPQLLKHPCPDSDYLALLRRFDALCRGERAVIRSAANRRSDLSNAQRQLDFDRVVDWTWHFVPGLLRELALAELVESRQGPGRLVRIRRTFPWYQPASERLEWTAWSAIVELALRGMIASWRTAHDRPPRERGSLVNAEESAHAAVAFARGKTERQPYALCIRLAGFERPGRLPDLIGAFRRIVYWEFSERDVPWPVEPASRCPSASVLWNSAAGRPIRPETAAYHLGIAT
jgi:hypothetical protein